jgi:glycerol-3-phosphate acyltransferase PlsY
MMLLTVAILIFSYICGSVPFGKLIALQHGVDIQKRGSGNIGFANVLRVLGWRAAIPVLVLDCAKGALPTFLAVQFVNSQTAIVVGIVAVLAHIFPIWLKFKGGKGVATSLGVLLAISPLVGTIGFATYVIGSVIIHKSSYASICAGIAVLISGIVIYPEYLGLYIPLLLITFWTLRKNLLGTVPDYDI